MPRRAPGPSGRRARRARVLSASHAFYAGTRTLCLRAFGTTLGLRPHVSGMTGGWYCTAMQDKTKFVIPRFIRGIQRSVHSVPSQWMDPGNKCRDDTVHPNPNLSSTTYGPPPTFGRAENRTKWSTVKGSRSKRPREPRKWATVAGDAPRRRASEMWGL